MIGYGFIFRPITEEEFFDAVEEELDKRDQMEQESNESNRLKQQAVTPNEHHSQSVGLDFKIRVSQNIVFLYNIINISRVIVLLLRAT